MSDKKKRRLSSSPDGGSCATEPVAKRTRSASRKRIETPEQPIQLEREISPERTILDMLNEDCWQALLNYVTMPDIIRSERVSKEWQMIVYRYLRGVRLCIRTSLFYPPSAIAPSVKCRVLKIHPFYHMSVIKKYGPAIVASDCLHEGGLRALGKNAPDLEELRVHEAQYHSLKNRAVHFGKLRRLWLHRVIRFKDSHISKFLGFTTLEELKIYDNQMMTGHCLNNLKSNIRSLQLGSCRRLAMSHILTASDRLAELTKLELNCNSKTVLQNVYKLIEKTPNLEYLGLEWYGNIDVGRLVEAMCGLKRLRHLGLNSNKSVKDHWLEAVGASCGELETLDIGSCDGITAAGVLAVCQAAGKTLTALGLSNNNFLSDSDVARCIAYCPKLEVIDLQCCRGVSHELPACIAVPRRRPLRMHLWSTTVYVAQQLYPESYPDLIMDFSIFSSKCIFNRFSVTGNSIRI